MEDSPSWLREWKWDSLSHFAGGAFSATANLRRSGLEMDLSCPDIIFLAANLWLCIFWNLINKLAELRDAMVEVIQIHYNILTENQCALAIVTKPETRASPMESLFLLWRSKCLYNLYRMKFVLRRRRMKRRRRRRRRRRRAPEAWLSGKLLPSPYLHTASAPLQYSNTVSHHLTPPHYTFTYTISYN